MLLKLFHFIFGLKWEINGNTTYLSKNGGLGTQ